MKGIWVLMPEKKKVPKTVRISPFQGKETVIFSYNEIASYILAFVSFLMMASHLGTW